MAPAPQIRIGPLMIARPSLPAGFDDLAGLSHGNVPQRHQLGIRPFVIAAEIAVAELAAHVLGTVAAFAAELHHLLLLARLGYSFLPRSREGLHPGGLE